MKYINKNKIISADILEPYQNNGEQWDFSQTHGWQVSFLIGFRGEYIIVDKESHSQCIELIQELDLIKI